METEEVSWPAKSKLNIKSRICSVERFECFKTHPRRSSSSKSSTPSFNLAILSSIFCSINLRMIDRDCINRTSTDEDIIRSWSFFVGKMGFFNHYVLWLIKVWLLTFKAFLYGVPGKFSGAETTPFMKVTYSFFSCSVSGFPGSKLIICFAIKLKVNCNFLLQ